MEAEKNKCCGTAPKLIFSCSGAADVGELCDKTARLLMREGQGKMYCLAGVGGGVDLILANTKAAAKVLALDGCPLDCARKTLDRAEIESIAQLRLSDHGMVKGSSPCTEETLERVAALARPLLAC